MTRTQRATAIAILCCAALASSSTAARLDFVYTTTVDATEFGLGAAEPATITFRYDPDTVPIALELGEPTVRVVYGPVYGRLLVRDDVVQLGGELSIDNDNNGSDVYSYGAADFVVGETVSGSIAGVAIRSAEIRFVDQSQPLSMLTSLDPPSGTSFTPLATFALFDFRGSSPNATRTFTPAQFGGFTFTAPEPDGAAAIAAVVLAALALQRRRYSS